MEIKLDMTQTVCLGVLVFLAGQFVVSKVHFLEKYCIPAPAVGGLLFSIINMAGVQTGAFQFAFDQTLKDFFMIAFFSTIGFSASLKIIKKGGIAIFILFCTSSVMLIIQNVWGVAIARAFGLNPLLGMCAGSISLMGGVGSSAAFAPIMEQNGAVGGLTFAIASATFGLVMGGLVSGPIAKFLIDRHKLKDVRKTGVKEVDYGSIDTRLIKIPGIYVDAIVVAAAENHMQTNGSFYNPAYSGEIRVPVDSLPPLPMGERKIIARRAAMELVPHAVTNLGIGMPEGVAAVAAEEGLEGMVLTTEAGTIGGIPAGGGDFGVTTNPDCVLDEPYQFDFYDGGGLDVAFLGLAQMDAQGNVNVSKFGPKIAGCGGFINITQNAKKVVYCGTFTAGGLKVGVEDGRLLIHQEGKVKKLIPAVEQITFSGQYAVEKGQPVLYITERAVFELTWEGVVLKEIAPGVDLRRDILEQMDFEPIVNYVELMDERIFRDAPMGLTF